ncbi:glycosyltransferase family 2 protein [Prochlorothrix hollandica]|uniref:Glycosyl transferase family 2 n=1 Tax=Prochlorothrix hollandica PCC 9006 = CALU 1027 TaxID=317619 RepID=A0A0M2Q179_PROHO|nr:glycosyltransferase family A protein [Prochlorothrix hollandica]KKJ01063.1 glycosyl transferase family 2 [Prochlorothrix hollandica PCC 9006 = CALU 1027]
MASVSICIPTYNRQDLLPWAIESVLQQTFQDWELVVCDDGSQDGTADRMARYGDGRIRYLRHGQNIGKSNNMRSGFEATTGDYFLKFDDDDRLCPDFLEKTVACLQQHPQVAFVGTDHWLIDRQNHRQVTATDQNSQVWGRSELPEGLVADLLQRVFVVQSFQVGATLFRRSALVAVDFMRSGLRNCEDNDLLVRLALGGAQGYYLPQRLMEYRVHGEQQGLDRAIPYLEDKIRYLDYFQFDREDLEQVRRSRLRESQLLLGLRQVERGQDPQGRALIRAAGTASPRAKVGLGLSYVPLPLRRLLFQGLRRLRGQDYSDRIRQGG